VFQQDSAPALGLTRQLIAWQWRLRTLFCPCFGCHTAET